jgi:hypothetical protein
MWKEFENLDSKIQRKLARAVFLDKCRVRSGQNNFVQNFRSLMNAESNKKNSILARNPRVEISNCGEHTFAF